MKIKIKLYRASHGTYIAHVVNKNIPHLNPKPKGSWMNGTSEGKNTCWGSTAGHETIEGALAGALELVGELSKTLGLAVDSRYEFEIDVPIKNADPVVRCKECGHVHSHLPKDTDLCSTQGCDRLKASGQRGLCCGSCWNNDGRHHSQACNARMAAQ